MGNVKWAVICARQAHDHLTGAPPKARAGLARTADLRAGVGPAGVAAADSGPPGAPELLDAMAEFLFSDVRDWVPRERRFQVLVAANLCAVLARELRAGSEPMREDLALCSTALGAEPPVGELRTPSFARRFAPRRRSSRRCLRRGELDETP